MIKLIMAKYLGVAHNYYHKVTINKVELFMIIILKTDIDNEN